MTESQDKSYYSDNNIDWVLARDYQQEAIIQAIEWYGREASRPSLDNTKLIYKYIKGSIIFTLTPFSSGNILEKVFVMTRDDMTFAYLKLVKPKYTKMIAQPGSTVTAEYMGRTININTGESYYIDNTTNMIAVGWHGTYNPPYGMDGVPVV
jgi:hypothetical protein